jgi:hypothetical protein
MILDDNNNPRVQAHGGAALVNFAEDAPKNILITYLDSIVNKLQDVLVAKVYDVIFLHFFLFNFSILYLLFLLKKLVQQKRKLVLEQIVTTIAAVADTVEEKFEPYYDK